MSRPTDRRTIAVCVFALGAALLGVSCAEPCETGEACARACPVGGQAICAAHGLCACLRGPDVGAFGGDAWPPDAGDGFARLDGGGPAANGCVSPGPGAIVINELMLDGEPTEDAEFVELVNRRMAPVDLAGVVLTSNRGVDQVRRVEFVSGCVPAGAAVALFADRSDWVESSPAMPPIEAELRSFGFANGGDFDFRLMRGDTVLDRLQGSGDLIEPGVSLNRVPDLEGSPRSHDAIEGIGRDASPGRCPGGGRYEDGCPPPDPVVDHEADSDAGPSPSDGGSGQVPDGAALDRAPIFDCPMPEPGELRMNEILIDGRVARTEADEFVEIVNLAAAPRRLRGVALAVEIAGAVETRVLFGDGCLPARGVMVLRPDVSDWLFEPPFSSPPVVIDARLALGNESRNVIALLGADGATHDRFDPAELDVVEGVSLNRRPELEGAEWVLHDRMSDAASSPGACADGGPFTEQGCAPPESVMPDGCVAPDAGNLVINEVLIDGAEPGEGDEFVELVNRSLTPVALGGVSLWTSRADGTLIERVEFEHGCLAPGALAIFGARDDWLGDDGLVARAERLALPNDAALHIELTAPESRWSVEIPRIDLEPGVSIVREADGDPDASWRAHDAISPLPASPGTRSDGTPYDGRSPPEQP